jgi:hypothetical protein
LILRGTTDEHTRSYTSNAGSGETAERIGNDIVEQHGKYIEQLEYVVIEFADNLPEPSDH